MLLALVIAVASSAILLSGVQAQRTRTPAPTLNLGEYGSTFNYGGGGTLFETPGWYMCPYGSALTGFYKSTCESISCLEDVSCAAPPGNSPAYQSCSIMDVGIAFDDVGEVVCPGSAFISGIYSSQSGAGGGLYNFEQLYCCEFIDYEVGDTAKQDWWACLDGQQVWCQVDTGEYINGLYRNGGGQELYRLEEARTRTLTAYTGTCTSASAVSMPLSMPKVRFTPVAPVKQPVGQPDAPVHEPPQMQPEPGYIDFDVEVKTTAVLALSALANVLLLAAVAFCCWRKKTSSMSEGAVKYSTVRSASASDSNQEAFGLAVH